MSRTPQAGMPKRLRDLTGLKVTCSRKLTNGFVSIPAGTVLTVYASPNWGSINLETEQCKHCSVQARVSGVDVRDLTLVDDDAGGDPTKPDLLKPRGNNGVVNAEICHCALLMLGDVGVTEQQISHWTLDQQAQAYDWAVRCSLHASDNDDVYVPPRPAFIPRGR